MAHDGVEALDYVFGAGAHSGRDPNISPALVLLDLRLPDIDGWQVLDSLKDDVELRHIPVHIISVEAASPRATRKGALGHLPKPVSPEGLTAVFEKIEATLARKVKAILVVEDHVGSRRALAGLLAGEDVQVDQAASAREAIEAIRNRSYDCVILDLGLGDMDGEQLLETLRDSPGLSLPPIVVYTGQDLSRKQELRLREFTDSIILKDVHSEERLLDEVSLFLHRVVKELPARQRQIITELHGSDTGLHGKKILLVDDDMRSAFALARVLTEHGLQAVKAENGERALRLLDEQPDFDLVLMDVMMPVMDGFEAIRRLRCQERFARLPILMLTAKAMRGDRDRCLAEGANDYLTKPVDTGRLLSLLRVWLCK